MQSMPTASRNFQIFVHNKDTSRRFALQVNGNTSVEELMQMIHNSTGIPTAQQRLTCAGQQLLTGMMLSQYQLRENTTIDLSRSWQIFVLDVTKNKSSAFLVNESNTVQELMQMIQKNMHIPPENQNLTYVGQNLNPELNLSHYQVTENTTIDLHIRPQPPNMPGNHCHGVPSSDPSSFQIFVKNFSDSKNYTFQVHASDRVEKLMRMIEEKLHIPTSQQVLTFAGKNLDPSMMLSHYDIKKESTIFLTGRLRGG